MPISDNNDNTRKQYISFKQKKPLGKLINSACGPLRYAMQVMCFLFYVVGSQS